MSPTGGDAAKADLRFSFYTYLYFMEDNDPMDGQLSDPLCQGCPDLIKISEVITANGIHFPYYVTLEEYHILFDKKRSKKEVEEDE